MDTPQQRAALRRNATAQKVRTRFPAGQRVVATVSGQEGTVHRHVPGLDAQGGYLVIDWDNGHRGRTTACNLNPTSK